MDGPWPFVRFTARQKIQLQDGVFFRYLNVLIEHSRKDSIWRAPGADFFMPSKPGTVGAEFIMENGGSVLASCFPPRVAAANLAAVQRPPEFPGAQRYELYTPQTGCVNDLSAPLTQRCWGARMDIEDVVTYGKDVETGGVPQPNNYYLHLLNISAFCRYVLKDDCIAALGPLGCMLFFLNNASALPPLFDTPASPPLSELPSALTAGAPTPSDEGGGGGDDDTARLVGILVGTIGGAAVLAGVAAAAGLWHRRRQRQQREAKHAVAGDPAADLSDPEASFGGLSPKREAERKAIAAAGASELASSGADSRDQRCSSRFSALVLGTAPQSAVPVLTMQTPFKPDTLLNVVVVAPVPTHIDTATADVGSPSSSQPPDVGPADAASPDTTAPETPEAGVPVVQLTGRVLGKGAFGSVFEGVFNGQRVAVKQMCTVSDGHEQSKAYAFIQELEVMARCEHPNIVRMLAACTGPPKPCLVMELMATSLDKVLYGRGSGSLLPLDLVLHIGMEIAQGLDYLHPTVMHRDLKPANVLLNDPTSDGPVVKLSDFGISRLRHSMLVTQNPEAGTPAYVAPECFDVSVGAITHKVDIYSYGVLMWEMLSGAQPWSGMEPVNIAMQVTMMERRLPMPPRDAPGSCKQRWPSKLQQVIEECWDKDPFRRPAASELLKRLALVRNAHARGCDRPS
ncbi:hypothetical protein HYH03_013063 [Edaphochlamys debaryana]|uniref:Protein kinase domain-containing protein n=1 Tax=Edaphochlamys debaryana TaxID=47281 RepID=A0A835XZA5_9CHLO|nr:hypothetical protein HYH03_013063 [Edaphochlamys debaryana]|eukprot:KAG2488374.1 hypothetical protein HYH03_013063 [Edaphochlamys debaryana]